MWDVKDKIFLPSCFYRTSFTLTMWDVKLDTKYTKHFKIEFYLNYVGCKVLSLIAYIDDIESFTLTMWDVK